MTEFNKAPLLGGVPYEVKFSIGKKQLTMVGIPEAAQAATVSPAPVPGVPSPRVGT